MNVSKIMIIKFIHDSMIIIHNEWFIHQNPFPWINGHHSQTTRPVGDDPPCVNHFPVRSQ
jgi:hypothetical protein